MSCDRSIPRTGAHWRELSSHVRSSALKEGANGVAGHTSSFCAAYQTGAGSMSKPRHGGIVEDGLPLA